MHILLLGDWAFLMNYFQNLKNANQWVIGIKKIML